MNAGQTEPPPTDAEVEADELLMLLAARPRAMSLDESPRPWPVRPLPEHCGHVICLSF